MKKSLLALAALTAFAGAASAQSSVTLFGVVDLNARVVDNANAGKVKSMSNDGNASSRFGFRGVEDLGGGMQAGFWLEGALAADNGGGFSGGALGNTANPLTFQRKATVSLMGGFGEIRLGRDYTPTFLNVAGYDVWGYVGVATIANARGKFTAAQGVGTTVRANNMISYFLPALGGLYGQVSVAAGENTQGNKYVGARIGYAAGPVNVSGAYGKTYKTVAMTDDLKNVSVGASYNMGFMTVMGSYEKQDYGSLNQKMADLGVAVPFGASTIKVSAARFSGSSDVWGVTQLGLGYQYDLSKRTALYANYGRDANKGNPWGATFTASGSGNAGMHGGETSTGYEFGVRHSF